MWDLTDQIFNFLSVWAGATICLHDLLDIYLYKLQWDTVSWPIFLLSPIHNTWWIVLSMSEHFSREFTHRVKSVSMAKFTTDEVSALQAGGNEVRYPSPAVSNSVRTDLVACVSFLICCSRFSCEASEAGILQGVGSSSQFSTRWQVLHWKTSSCILFRSS